MEASTSEGKGQKNEELAQSRRTLAGTWLRRRGSSPSRATDQALILADARYVLHKQWVERPLSLKLCNRCGDEAEGVVRRLLGVRGACVLSFLRGVRTAVRCVFGILTSLAANFSASRPTLIRTHPSVHQTSKGTGRTSLLIIHSCDTQRWLAKQPSRWSHAGRALCCYCHCSAHILHSPLNQRRPIHTSVNSAPGNSNFRRNDSLLVQA